MLARSRRKDPDVLTRQVWSQVGDRAASGTREGDSRGLGANLLVLMV